MFRSLRIINKEQIIFCHNKLDNYGYFNPCLFTAIKHILQSNSTYSVAPGSGVGILTCWFDPPEEFTPLALGDGSEFL